MKLSMMILIAISLLSGYRCGKSADPDARQQSFNESMNRQAYLGPTQSTLYLKGYERLPSVNGKGSFSIDKIKGDSSTLVLMMELPGQEGFSLAIPGKQTARSWAFNATPGALLIRENGEIHGTITAKTKKITWNGRLFDDKLMLDIKINYLIAEGDIPKESILDTHFELLRSSSGQSNGGQQDCKIVWESRPVFNLYSGGIDLIYVPVCH